MARGNDQPFIFALPIPVWIRLSLVISFSAALVLTIGSIALSVFADASPPSYTVLVNALALGLWVLLLNLLASLLAYAAIYLFRRVRR